MLTSIDKAIVALILGLLAQFVPMVTGAEFQPDMTVAEVIEVIVRGGILTFGVWIFPNRK